MPTPSSLTVRLEPPPLATSVALPTGEVEQGSVDHVEANPVLRRIFARMPAHVRATFTHEQIDALGRASIGGGAGHALAVRRTVSVLGKRFYLALFIGADKRRKLTRLELFIRRGMRESWFRRLVTSVALLAAAAVFALGVICVLYLVKSLLGIDLMPGPSILHNLLYWR